MLTEPLYQALQSLGLRGMARQYGAQQQSADLTTAPFHDRLALLIDAEQAERSNYRYAQRLRWAKLGQNASLEDLDRRTPRGLDKPLIAQLTTLAFVNHHRNVPTGPTNATWVSPRRRPPASQLEERAQPCAPWPQFARFLVGTGNFRRIR
jgi:hypothetical protein